MRLMMISSWL